MTETEQPTEQAPGSLNLATILQRMLAVSDKVSDLIFSPGRPPQIELVGKLQPVAIPGLDKLTPPQTAAIAKLIIGSNEEAAQSLEKLGSTDVSFSVPSLCRFRVNIFKQRGSHAIVMRVIPMRPPRFSDFNLPEQLQEIADIKNGIVLVTGPTGSGKSSTLAAVIGPAP
jgi:twitching motility protein PilT